MISPYSLTEINTRDPGAVCDAVVYTAQELYGRDADKARIERLFQEVTDIFSGRFIYFQKMDTVYHDLEHTLQAALCWARLFCNYQHHSERAKISIDFFHIGLAAVLLHDIGYLKEECDEHGTGAKFTLVHERRSCELAHIFLADRGWERKPIFAVQHIISCTGTHAVIDAVPFRHRSEKVLGQMVCTADYLGQMSDPRYLEKLPVLFLEFQESDNHRCLPEARRVFPSLDKLLEKTPDFWHETVLPKLTGECEGLLHYLATPYPDGENVYLDAIEHNLTELRALNRRRANRLATAQGEANAHQKARTRRCPG